MFFLIFNYYSQKLININLHGKCYELLEPSYDIYKNLEIEKKSEIVMLQIQAIGNP